MQHLFFNSTFRVPSILSTIVSMETKLK